MDWLLAFRLFFYIPTSIMLLVLRLHPSTKKIQRRIVLVAKCLNFVIILIVEATYGVKCIPIEAA